MNAGNLTAFFSYASFDIPGQSPFVETYLSVIGSSVRFIEVDGGTLQGQIEVYWYIRAKGDETILQSDKYILNSPPIEATGDIPDFIDQHRWSLQNGSYELELSIRDHNSESQETSIKQEFIVDFPTDTISISDIELIDSYSKSTATGKFIKNGYTLTPFVNSFYPNHITNLRFYAEIYRSNVVPADDYLVRYYITSREKNLLVDNYINTIKQTQASVNALLGDFDIINLVSGNYNLNIELRNKQNKLIAFRQISFQRSNPRNKPALNADLADLDITNTFITSEVNTDTLEEYVACLYPISSAPEIQTADNILISRDRLAMQQYIYYFWSKRNPEDPESAWLKYHQEVLKANNSFASINLKGYETDRGRVYLQNGPPNQITEVKDEPSTLPYEIWHYYKMGNQTNRKFVFYATNRSSNDYRLIHSDALGELQEPQWEVKLHQLQEFGIDLDQEKTIDTYGSRMKDNFSNPR